jgi:ATP-dependent helicase/nuclease subunit A
VHNFRSRPAVIDWANGVFETLFAASGPRHAALSSEPDRMTTPSVWVVRPAESAAGAEAERRAEAAALVAFVARALRDGWPVRTPTGTRPIQPRDVALLFARTSGIEIYEAALRRAGLPFQQEGGRLFFQRQEVRDVLQALSAIDDPHDELALVATLRSPLFGITDNELWLHRVQHGGFGYLQPPPESPLAPALEALAALHAARHTDGVAGTIAALLDRTGARAFHAVQPHGPQALANLEMLQRHAREFELSGAGLREFVRMLRAVDRDVPRVAEWAPQEDEEDRIRVLTVHMAKGLEFGCVVLANLGARANQSPSALLVDRLAGRVEVRLRPSDAEVTLRTAGFDVAWRRERERDAAEERRLLYVAATRARDYLVLPEPVAAAQGFARLLRAAPAAFGDGGVLGPFVDAGAEVPEAPACRVDAAALPAPVPVRQPRATRAELVAASHARDAWAGAHARRLQAGGAGEVAEAAPVAAVAPAWPWRLLVARVLDAAATDEPIAAAARRLSALHGAAAYASEVAELAARALEFEHRQESRRVRHGVQITAAAGGRWIEERLDVVLLQENGLRVVQWSLEPAPGSPHAGEPLVALGALARAAAMPVHGGGTLCLATGTFVPFADLADRLATRSS